MSYFNIPFSGKGVLNVLHKLSFSKALISKRTEESKITSYRGWPGNTEGNLDSAWVSENFLELTALLWSYSEGESCKTSDHVRLPWTAANSITTCLLPKVKNCLGTITVSDVRLACSALWLSWELQLRSWGQILPTWEVTNFFWFHCDLGKV